MRFLITGGTGFIGSRLARRLLADGHEVRLLSLVNTSAEAANAVDLTARGAELLTASVADRAVHEPAVDGVDIVHHVAATMREANVPDAVFWDTNVSATQDLLRTSMTAGVGRFVYCSTMGVTGETRGVRVDENAPYRPKDIYQRTKAAAEQWVIGEAGRKGWPVTVVRPADVYGPGDRRLAKLFRMVQRGRFFYVGTGHGRRHMIYIDDLLDGMIAAQQSDSAIGEVFLLAGPTPIPLRGLVEHVADALGVSRPRVRVPYQPVWLLAAGIEATCRPLGVQPPLYPRRVEFYSHDYEFDTTKAGRLLDFAPRTDIPEGVRRTIASYREEGLLA